jgi:ADP-dependent phosphofructokinase/glucokinase
MGIVISIDALRGSCLPAASRPLRPPAASPDPPSRSAATDRVSLSAPLGEAPAREPRIAFPAPFVPLAGTPLSIALPALDWPAPAAREARAHVDALGLSAERHGFADMAQAEVERGERVDPRVTETDMARAVARAHSAASLRAAPQTGLYGFTRLIDAKFHFDGPVLEALAGDVPAEELKDAIDRGPGGGAIPWEKPSSRVELLASLVRQIVLGKGASLQLNISAALAEWMEDGVKRSGGSLNEAMGGAGAFCANLAAAQPGVEAHFYSATPLPPRVAARFGDEVSVVSTSGQMRPARACGDRALADRVNFSAEYTREAPLSLYGARSVVVDGVRRPLEASGSGRVILGTPGTNQIGFGDIAPEALSRIAREHDTFFFVGAHYLTKGSSVEAQVAAAGLASQLDALKRANPRLLIHGQYVIPKDAANEAGVMAQLRGHLDSMSLNTVEVPGLLNRLHSAGLADVAATSSDRSEAEKPANAIAGAAALKKAMGLSRLHLHGFDGDLLVVDEADDRERQVLALLRARQAASMKTANPSGEIRAASEMWPVAPLVEGGGLAAVYGFADAMRSRLGLDDAAHAAIVRDWWVHDPTRGETWFFVPSRGIHDRSGGTVSLGDTIDSTALIYGR